ALTTIYNAVVARNTTPHFELWLSNGFELFFDVGRTLSPTTRRPMYNRFAAAAHPSLKNYLDGATQMSSTLHRFEHTNDELSNLSCCRRTSRNGYVVTFSFFGSNASPFFQTASAIAAIFRANVRRAISSRIPFSWRAFKNGPYALRLLALVAAVINTSFKRRL